jgi:lipid-binding SYLF domain-containing protein
MGSFKVGPNRQYIILLALVATLPSTAAKDDTPLRLERAAKVLNDLTDAKRGIRAEQLAHADCIAVIPGFKKGAAVVGVGFGRGFMSCRNDKGWSTPAAMALESGSLGVQFGGEEFDIVMLSLDKEQRHKLLGERFTIGSDASAAWGNGKSEHEDANAKFIFYGITKGVFAGFGLDGATLKPDHSGNKAIYGKPMTMNEIITSGADAPAIATRFIAALPGE